MHAVPEGCLASPEHGLFVNPGQFSLTSHSPAAVRQVNVAGRTKSPGQTVLVPVHVSSGSHTSPEPTPQIAPAFPGGYWQSTLVPSHWSSVHGLVSGWHGV